MSERVSNYEHTYSVFFLYLHWTEREFLSCIMTFKETFCAKKDINLASFCFFMIQKEWKKKKKEKTQQKVPACLFKSQADMLTFSPQHKKRKESVFICKLPGLLAQIYEKKPTTSPYTFTWLNMYASVDQDNTPDCVRNVGKKKIKKKKGKKRSFCNSVAVIIKEISCVCIKGQERFRSLMIYT